MQRSASCLFFVDRVTLGAARMSRMLSDHFTSAALRRLHKVLACAGAALLLTACGGGDELSRQALAAEERQRTLALSTSEYELNAQALDESEVCFYLFADHWGPRHCSALGVGTLPFWLRGRVSSVSMPDGLQVDLFAGRLLNGTSVSLFKSALNLGDVSFDNQAASFRIDIAPQASAARLWSDPATWGGNKPVAGVAVVVPAGLNLILDENTPDLGPVTIRGSLTFKPGAEVELKASVIMIQSTGALRAGSADSPFTGKATITLTATDPQADPSLLAMGTRGILVYAGGTLALFGHAPAVTWTRLNAHGDVAATELTVADSVNWRAGDQLVVAPTEWYPVTAWAPQTEHDAATPTERISLKLATDKTIALETGLAAFKWGALQYITDQGLSLSPGTFTAPHADAAQVLDERAEVGNLTRNIVIQGADDTLWQSNGFGAQVMVMDRSSTLQLDGVELRRVGQAGRVGRYPIHWHLLSYNTDTGAELGDAQGHFVRNSSVWNSRQRCMVIHGTNGVELRNNICYDIKGHAIFLEDAVERRNTIEGNLVLRVRSPEDALLVSRHEQRGSAGGCGGAAAGYWLTNPDNTVRNNAVADAQGNGFWLSYPAKPVKQNAKVPVRPVNLPHAAFESNRSRANGHFGLELECAMVDDTGATDVIKYAPTATGLDYDYNNGVRFTLRGLTIAKNREGGYLNRATMPDYRQFVMAGNLQRSVTGAVAAGTFKHGLIVAKSLNNREPVPFNADPQLGIASYHSQMDIAENTFVGFENKGYVRTTNGADKSSGTFGTDDYYIRPVEKGFWRNAGNRLVNSDPGYRALPPHLQVNYTPESGNQWTLAGALWDPHGLWGAAGRYWVLDSPFLRDASCGPLVSQVPLGIANGLLCAGPYYGVQEFWLNRSLPEATDRYVFHEALSVTRVDSTGLVLGTWTIEPGHRSNLFGHMRHFAALRGDGYIVRFPQFPNGASVKAPPRWVQFQVEGLLGADDSVLIGMHFDGAVVPSRVLASTNPDYPVFDLPGANSRMLLPAASKAAVEAGSGGLYWQDSANHLVWIKATALGLAAPWASVLAGSDDDLYRAYSIRIEP